MDFGTRSSVASTVSRYLREKQRELQLSWSEKITRRQPLPAKNDNVAE